jgi:hypothetical protein
LDLSLGLPHRAFFSQTRFPTPPYLYLTSLHYLIARSPSRRFFLSGTAPGYFAPRPCLHQQGLLLFCETHKHLPRRNSSLTTSRNNPFANTHKPPPIRVRPRATGTYLLRAPAREQPFSC